MGKERGERSKVINADAERIRPILKKDPDWPLASGQINWKDKGNYFRKRNAVSRLTRKAVRELYPEYKVHVLRGRGTASNWIDVDFVIPNMERPDSLNIIQRTKALLLSVGIQYGSYFPDSGPGDDWTPCLLVTINHGC
jgi:hypothetical protein